MPGQIIQIIFIPLLIALNAFFVAAEMALARIRRTRVDQLVEEGNKTAELVQKQLDHPDTFIAACQLGITLCTLALGSLGEHTFAHHLTDYVMSLGLSEELAKPVASAAQAICYVVAFSITAFLQTVFGELIPKTWTFQRAESVMMAIIWPMEVWCWVTTPFNKVLNGFTAFILGLLQVTDPPHRQFVYSEEELKMLVSASQEEGVLQEEQEEMLHSVFDFSDTIASEVMTPRTDMICLPASATVKEFVDLTLQAGLSRLPIYEENIDSIFGLVHIRDGLRAMVDNKHGAHIREFARKILIVPENKNAGDLLTEFKKTKTHMAIVVDEYGATRGLVTIEDLLEELVGDIADEYDIVQEFIQEQEDGSILLDAKISLDEVNEKLELNIEDEEFNTLGGHIFGDLGQEPKVGDEVVTDNYTLRVEAADRHRIIRVRLIKHPKVEVSANGDGTEAEAGQNAQPEKPSKSSKPPKSLEPSK